MVEEIHRADGQIEHPTVRYEKSDAKVGWIFIVLIVALFLGFIIEIAVWRFFFSYREYQAQVKRSPYPLAPEPSTALPREPRLEQIDRVAGNDNPNVRDRELGYLDVLNSFGPAQEKGFVHIPIDRAMQLLLEKKTLKNRTAPPADERRRSEGLIDAGEPNSGRLFKGESK